ncbi:uncharacterized protein [Cicer arietinum]|uniref:uncharacterized protein n=1 Tax=Cicer arietinum TaxID=3827 RepID=UPI003CC531B8
MYDILLNYVSNEVGHISKTHLWVSDVLEAPPNVSRIITRWNSNGQPVGSTVGLLGGFLDEIARKFKDFPIMYDNWKLVPSTRKNKIFKDKMQEKADKNAANRGKLTILHTLGSKTLAWKKDEEEFSLLHLFVHEQLQIEIGKTRSPNEAFVNVFGKEHLEYVRCMGFGITPSQITHILLTLAGSNRRKLYVKAVRNCRKGCRQVERQFLNRRKLAL